MTAQAHSSLFHDVNTSSLPMRMTALARMLVGALPFFDDVRARFPAIFMARPLGTSAAAPVSPEALRRFQAIIIPHLDAAYNFARFLSRDADAARDIVQEAFLRAHRSFDSYRDGDPRAWIFAIVRNCYRAWLLDGRRRSRYEVPMAADNTAGDAEPPAYQVASDAETPEAAAIQNNQSARVRNVIGSLPEPMREILVLRELEDLSYRQISEIIDAPIGTVMSRLARARAEFGEAWRALESSGVAR